MDSLLNAFANDTRNMGGLNISSKESLLAPKRSVADGRDLIFIFNNQISNSALILLQ